MSQKSKARRSKETATESALLTPEEARSRLRLSRSAMYALLEVGGIKHVRLGRKILIPLVVIEGIERGEITPAAA